MITKLTYLLLFAGLSMAAAQNDIEEILIRTKQLETRYEKLQESLEKRVRQLEKENQNLKKTKDIKIVFVDMKKILCEYAKAKDLNVWVAKESLQAVLENEKIEEKCRLLQEEIPMFRAGSNVREEKEKELLKAKFDIEVLKQKLKCQIKLKRKNKLISIYWEIWEEIITYSKEKNYFITLQFCEPNFLSDSEEQLWQKIRFQNLFYYDSNAGNQDITQKILKRLNKKYHALFTQLFKN